MSSQDFKPSKLWRTAQVYTPGYMGELLQNRIITIRPGENKLETLLREGFDIDSRVAVIGD
jgi:hypothetical protein